MFLSDNMGLNPMVQYIFAKNSDIPPDLLRYWLKNGKIVTSLCLINTRKANPRGLAVDFNGVTCLSDGVSRTTLYGDDEESRSLWRTFTSGFADVLAQLGNSGASSPGGSDSVVMRISGNHCPASPLALQQFIQTFNGHTVASWGEYCSLFHVDIGFR